MADKNLHDIKIDELDSPKKTPLKNILTLLALLFIILVISVVITKLILNTDEDTKIENNDSKSELLNDLKDSNTTSDTKESNKKDETAGDIVPVLNSNIIERNLSSVIKTPLTSHTPKKDVKVIKTYSEPKKNTEPKKVTSTKAPSTPKITTPKKEYIDKVVVKRNTESTSRKNISFLGGKQKAVTNSYYIKVGTYRDSTTVVNKVKKNNYNYSLVKVENDKTLTRVLVGPFFSRNQANAQLAKVKANILTGAYVTKAK